MLEILEIPDILTRSFHLWVYYVYGNTPEARRSNEDKMITLVSDFFTTLGFKVEEYKDALYVNKEDIKIYFSYSQRHEKIMRKFTIHQGDKKKPISFLQRLVEKYNSHLETLV